MYNISPGGDVQVPTHRFPHLLWPLHAMVLVCKDGEGACNPLFDISALLTPQRKPSGKKSLYKFPQQQESQHLRSMPLNVACHMQP